jgi:formylglycine-generating enzyme
MVTIPAGKFLRGSDSSTEADEKPQKEVMVSEYQIGIVPVTVGMYEEYVAATKGAKMPDAPKDFNQDWSKKDHPMVNVSWHDAQKFAEWATKVAKITLLLPSEAQWEKAARGVDGREYPWGNDWDSSKCCCGENSNGGTASVGSYPSGANEQYGLLDMAGNVWEWCLDWYGADWYKNPESFKNDPSGPMKGSTRVLRGGSWWSHAPIVFRCACRYEIAPADWHDLWGFRLASPSLPRA